MINLFRNETTIITDKKEQRNIIEIFHKSMAGMHRGIRSTLEKIKQRFRWKTMKDDVKNVIKQCHDCQLNKQEYNRKKIPLKLVTSAEYPFEKVMIDTIGPFNISANGDRYCLTIMDDFSKYLIICPIAEQTAETIARSIVHELCLKFTVPKYLLSDNFSAFNSETFKEMCKLFKIKKLNSTPYHPESNGSLERVHHTIKVMIKAMINDKLDDWNLLLDFSVSVYNKTFHESLGMSPYKIIFGCQPRQIEVSLKEQNRDYNYDDCITRLKINLAQAREIAKEKVLKSKESRKKRFDLNAREFDISVGDQIVVKTNFVAARKFRPNFTGPFVVVEVFDEYVKYLDNNKVCKAHKNNIRRYLSDN